MTATPPSRCVVWLNFRIQKPGLAPRILRLQVHLWLPLPVCPAQVVIRENDRVTAAIVKLGPNDSVVEQEVPLVSRPPTPPLFPAQLMAHMYSGAERVSLSPPLLFRW